MERTGPYNRNLLRAGRSSWCSTPCSLPLPPFPIPVAGGHGPRASVTGALTTPASSPPRLTLWDTARGPPLGQVFRLARTCREQTETRRAVHYGITSLALSLADAARLLALKRGHWQIEHGLHFIKT